MGYVEPPARWHGHRDPHWHRGPFWLRRRGQGGPLRRDPADRLAGGVAAGVAAWCSATAADYAKVVAAYNAP